MPTEVVINIGDKNDNGPKIVTSTEHIAIAKGQLATPVLITVCYTSLSMKWFIIMHLEQLHYN